MTEVPVIDTIEVVNMATAVLVVDVIDVVRIISLVDTVDVVGVISLVDTVDVVGIISLVDTADVINASDIVLLVETTTEVGTTDNVVLSVVALQPGRIIWVIRVIRVTFFVGHLGLTWILHWIMCIINGIWK